MSLLMEADMSVPTGGDEGGGVVRRCSNCGTDNEAARKFCEECGAALAALCLVCGSANGARAKFCGECGSPLTDGPTVQQGSNPAHAAEAVASRAERRLVSILFVDLVGFTSLSESRDPEEVREVLSRYFEICRTVVERYGGVIEKFIGDAVMALWGAPVAKEDDAERAVRAAFEIVDAVPAFGRDSGVEELRARAAVASGEAAVNIGAAGHGLVAGDIVNTASRIQAAAEPGTILVDVETRSMAERAVAFVPAGELRLKGKAEPVEAWRAVRVVAERRGAGRAEALEPPFVGRTEELRLIKELLHATERERRARIVSVTGIGGMGKSRLAWELRKYTDGLAYSVYWHEGRSPSYGDGITFWALSEMVRMRAGIAETEDAASSRAKLSSTVADYLTDADERAWVEPRLAHLLGLAEAPPGGREELFSAWRTFFERVADRGLTVLVFEDCQWADAGALDFVESLLEWSKSHAIFILTLARPELTDRRPTWGAGQHNFASLRLESLSEDEMAELIGRFVHGLRDADVRRIVARADGVPLYAVEFVRMLADEGILVPSADGYDVVGEVHELDVPPNLHALIAARLDALDERDRMLVQDAAILGQSFTIHGLVAVTGHDREDLEPRLRDLTKKEFLSLDVDPRSPERGQYSFVQGLIREVASSTVGRADRRAKHLAAAHHFESLDDEELAGVVAAHYVEAHLASTSGPDADALAARARDWLSRGAERAMSLGSPEQALAFIDKALSLTPVESGRVPLLLLAGEAADRAGSFDRAAVHLEEAIGISNAAGDSAGAALGAARLAGTFAKLGKHADAIERMERALAAVPADADEQTLVELFTALAFANGSTGSQERALQWAERALPLAERLDRMDLLARAIGIKGFALFNLGRHQEGLILARGSLALAERSGSLKDQAWAFLTLGTYLADDDPRGALDAWRRAAEMAIRAGEREAERIALLNTAEAAVDHGEWAQARAALDTLAEAKLSERQGFVLASYDAMLTALQGDQAGAAELLRTSAKARQNEHIHFRAIHARASAVVALACGRFEEAYAEAMEAVAVDPAGINSPVALYAASRAGLWLRDQEKIRTALTGLESFSGAWTAAVRRTAEAGLAALDGRLDVAARSYSEAIAAWRKLDSPLDVALCELDFATFVPGDDEADAAAEHARTVFERLGAIPLLERLGDHVSTSG